LGREVARSGRVVHRTIEIASWDAGSCSLLHAELVTLSDLALQLLPPDLSSLSKGDVERLGTNHFVVHLCDSLGGFLGRREAYKAKTLGMILVVTHDLGASDASIGLELSTEFVIVDVVLEILDIQVDTLVFAELLHLGLFISLAQLFLALRLLLSTGNKQLSAVVLGLVEGVDGRAGILVVVIVDESETLALSLMVGLKYGGCDRPVLLEEFVELLLGNLWIKVLHVDVCKLFFLLVELSEAFLLGDMVSDIDLSVVQQHAIDGLDGTVSSLGSVVMDKAVAFGTSAVVRGDFAGKNIPERRKGVMESLVVDLLVEILDKDIALTGLADGGISLGPHDTACSTFNKRIVELLQSPFTVRSIEIVDISIAQRATSDSITANTNAGNRTDHIKDLEEHGLGDTGVQFSNIERGRGGRGHRRLGVVGRRRRCLSEGGRRSGLSHSSLGRDILSDGGRRHFSFSFYSIGSLLLVNLFMNRRQQRCF
jgi:hypothetical protein